MPRLRSIPIYLVHSLGTDFQSFYISHSGWHHAFIVIRSDGDLHSHFQTDSCVHGLLERGGAGERLRSRAVVDPVISVVEPIFDIEGKIFLHG